MLERNILRILFYGNDTRWTSFNSAIKKTRKRLRGCFCANHLRK